MRTQHEVSLAYGSTWPIYFTTCSRYEATLNCEMEGLIDWIKHKIPTTDDSSIPCIQGLPADVMVGFCRAMIGEIRVVRHGGNKAQGQRRLLCVWGEGNGIWLGRAGMVLLLQLHVDKRRGLGQHTRRPLLSPFSLTHTQVT